MFSMIHSPAELPPNGWDRLATQSTENAGSPSRSGPVTQVMPVAQALPTMAKTAKGIAWIRRPYRLGEIRDELRQKPGAPGSS